MCVKQRTPFIGDIDIDLTRLHDTMNGTIRTDERSSPAHKKPAWENPDYHSSADHLRQNWKAPHRIVTQGITLVTEEEENAKGNQKSEKHK
jgi:hypothetical protein